MLATDRLWNRPIYWQINSAYFQREHPLVTRVLNVQQAVTMYLWVTHWSSSCFSHLLLLLFWRIDFSQELLTLSLTYIWKHLHPSAPPPGRCRQLAQAWNHFSLICYSFKMTICQLWSMKGPWTGWSLCVFLPSCTCFLLHKLLLKHCVYQRSSGISRKKKIPFSPTLLPASSSPLTYTQAELWWILCSFKWHQMLLYWKTLV